MPNFYTYFISSLPVLSFGMKPPFSFAEFIQRCRELIPQEDTELLEQLPSPDKYTEIFYQPTIAKWVTFDAALRNELAKIRASRRHLDTAGFLRPAGKQNAPFLTQVAWQIYRNPSIIEAEKTYGQICWQALDELANGHYFDLDFLIVYAYKLRILERWERVLRAPAKELLESALTG